MMLNHSSKWTGFLGLIPFAFVALIWWIIPQTMEYPKYMLPPIQEVVERYFEMVQDGSLLKHTLASLRKLAIGFGIGSVLAIMVGVSIASSRRVSEYLSPLLTFLQSIAGVAWIPLAIIWFGTGTNAVLFVIINTIFFSCINNVVTGVQQIPEVLRRAALSNGASPIQILFNLTLPGALVQLIVGFRTSLAFGWRALVAGEMIASAKGLGYMTLEAVQWYQTGTVMSGMITIGVLWLILDRWLFKQIEYATVVRWGILKNEKIFF